MPQCNVTLCVSVIPNYQASLYIVALPQASNEETLITNFVSYLHPSACPSVIVCLVSFVWQDGEGGGLSLIHISEPTRPP